MTHTKMFDASDSTSWAHCRRRAYYDYQPPTDDPLPVDRFDELVMDMGMVHESAVLATLGPYEVATSADHTAALMAAGVPLIYQGTLIDETRGVVCKPDFLRLDDGQYRAEDAKLTSSVRGKKAPTAQIGTYDIVLGSSNRARALMPNDEAYELTDKDLDTANAFLADMQHLTSTKQRPDANYTATKCAACPYSEICVPEFESQGNLGLDYFVDNRALPKLSEAGITTLADLAAADSQQLEKVPYLKKETRRENAILQAQSLLTKTIIRIAQIPSIPGTPIHFDIETWPFGADGAGTVYLWGFLPPPYRPQDYCFVWADEADGGDFRGWLAFLELIERFRADYSDPTLVHFTDFELIQIRRYAERYEMQDHPTVDWLLNHDDSCFDIKAATSSSLILPVTGYGLKTICKNEKLVNFQWELNESGSQWSVVRYADYLALEPGPEKDAVRAELLTYNKDDNLATRALEMWLAKLP